MSEREIQIQAHTGFDGVVHLDLDILTDIINQDIQLTVSYKASQDKTLREIRENKLQEILGEVKPARDLTQYAGTIRLKEDALTFQKRIRSEW